MKIYVAYDINESENTMFFGRKKDALNYIKEEKHLDKERLSTNILHEEASLTLEVIEFKPNKKGILDAMENATHYVGSRCGGVK